jgi:hypothetical protein
VIPQPLQDGHPDNKIRKLSHTSCTGGSNHRGGDGLEQSADHSVVLDDV